MSERRVTTSDNQDLSDRAISAILQIDREFGKSVLLELRKQPLWEWFFCYASLEYGDDSFIDPLCTILLGSQNPNARYMAAVALERLGNLNAQDPLTEALNDPGEDYEGREIKEQAQRALDALYERANSALAP